MIELSFFRILSEMPTLDGAVCAQVDGELFFPKEGGRPGPAKTMCASCPARIPCLAWALTNREPFGIWGGLTANERRRLLAKQAA